MPTLKQLSHTRPRSTAFLSLQVADNLTAEQADSTLLELLAAATALSGVVLLYKAMEISRQINQIEGEVGRQ